MKEYDLYDFEHGYGNRFQRFQDLIRHKVHNILLASSIYDSFILAEDGRLYESLISEYMGLNLSDAPGITRVSNGREAVNMALERKEFDLVITSLRLEDMSGLDFAREVRAAGIDTPIILLTYDARALNDLMATSDLTAIDRVFIWQGDFRILLAIIKFVEDRLNVEHDTELVGVQSIILIEDNVRFYSSYLPIIYTELMRHSHSLISEGVNRAHRLLRMRARPRRSYPARSGSSRTIPARAVRFGRSVMAAGSPWCRGPSLGAAWSTLVPAAGRLNCGRSASPAEAT